MPVATLTSHALKSTVERLEAVKRYENFHKGREKDLQDIVMLAAHIFDTPIAFVALIDDETQWIKAKVVVDADTLPASTSFCMRTVMQENTMVVEDALCDDRFATLPTVIGQPNIRFYAGVNLKSIDGQNAGTICVYDLKPKKLTAVQ